MATILYFNRSNPFYLKYSIAQTVEVCRGSRVILLGDDTNRHLDLCEWHPISSYWASAGRFAPRYRHFSTNDRDFDLGCFQTWFVFDEFARKESLSGPLVCLDHDILLYRDIDRVFQEADFDLATTSVVGNQYTLFRTPDVLHGYTRFMEETYASTSGLELLERIYRTKSSPVPLPGGWICDMTLLGLYATQPSLRLLDLATERAGAVYDYALGSPEGFAYDRVRLIKRLRREGHGYYGIRAGRKVQFAGIHFQVGAKVYLPHYYTARRRFPDRFRHEYVRWRGRATALVKRALYGAGLLGARG